MKPVVFGAIMDFFSEGKAVMLDEPVETVTDTTILDDDDEVVAMIKELLQERVGGMATHPLCVCSPDRPLALPACLSKNSAKRKKKKLLEKSRWTKPLEKKRWTKVLGNIVGECVGRNVTFRRRVASRRNITLSYITLEKYVGKNISGKSFSATCVPVRILLGVI